MDSWVLDGAINQVIKGGHYLYTRVDSLNSLIDQKLTEARNDQTSIERSGR